MPALIRLHPETELVRGPQFHLLMNHQSGECLSFDNQERYLVHLILNTETVPEVCSAFQKRYQESVTPAQVTAFIEQLQLRGLLFDSPESAGTEAAPLTKKQVAVSKSSFLNLFFDLLVLFFGWILHPLWILPTLFLMLGAAVVLVRNGDRVVLEHFFILQHYSVPYYFVFILIPKHFLLSSIEALLVGMSCRRFGGRIRGLAIRLRGGILPALRTELDDSILMLPPRGRHTLMAVGIWSVLAIGSAAVIGTEVTNPNSELRQICVLLILPCLVRAVIVSNVFYRFSSAYLLLVDAIGDRLLMDDAIVETGRWLSFLPPAKKMTERRRFWLRVYGSGYFIYRLIVSIAILLLGYHWSVNGMGFLGVTLTLAAVVWFNYDLFQKKSEVRMPTVTAAKQ